MTNSASILCISDIQWEIPGKDTLDTLKTDVAEVSLSAVFFGGDVINDGGNSEEHLTEFVELLRYLEDLEISSFIIQGNHDEYSSYDKLEQHIHHLEYADEISGEVVEFNGLKILGLPYSYTHYLRNARQISEEFSDEYDVVLAHAERSRRIWLFELDARFIITGHFAERLYQIQNHVFASMGSYPTDIVKIEPGSGELTYTRRADSYYASQDRYEAKVRVNNGVLTWERDEHEPDAVTLRRLQDREYANQIERLLTAKTEVKTASKAKQKEIVEELLEMGIPKTHIREYIGRYDFL